MQIAQAVQEHDDSISSTESDPSTASDGVPTYKGLDSVLWFFHGGTSATLQFWAYDGAQGGWCKAGTQDITGDEVVIQQAAGDRMHCTITTHGGGTYKRSSQYLRG